MTADKKQSSRLGPNNICREKTSMLGTCIQEIVFERPVRNKGNIEIKTGAGESNVSLRLSEELHRYRMKKLRCSETVTVLLLSNNPKLS